MSSREEDWGPGKVGFVPTSTTWKIEGDYVEGCDCDAFCQCVYLGPPGSCGCHVTIAWHIAKGHHGPTRLDRLNVVAMFHAPGHMLTGPLWNAAFYLDSKANPAQAEALGKIFGGQAGGFFGEVSKLIGEVKGIRMAPIKVEKQRRSRHVRIPNILDLHIEAVKGVGEKEELALLNLPSFPAAGGSVVAARSKEYSYEDHGYSFAVSGKNAFYCSFSHEP